jgi:hypothetical protein
LINEGGLNIWNLYIVGNGILTVFVNLLIMNLEMLWSFILGKCTSSLPEIRLSGTQIGNKNYESYRSNYESYNILIPQAVLKK